MLQKSYDSLPAIGNRRERDTRIILCLGMNYFGVYSIMGELL